MNYMNKLSPDTINSVVSYTRNTSKPEEVVVGVLTAYEKVGKEFHFYIGPKFVAIPENEILTNLEIVIGNGVGLC